MIAGLLGWTKLPQWAMELIVIAAIVAGLGALHHHILDQGIAEQVAKDKVATDKLNKETADQTAALKAKATTAETNYASEHADNVAYRNDHPDLKQPVRLCGSDNSRAILSSISSANHGNENPGTAAANVPAVPGGDSGIRGEEHPDISELLDLLALRADNVSATLREFQSR